MSYFRTGFSSFAEFKREGMQGSEGLGKEELELLHELEAEDDWLDPERRASHNSPWD